MSEAGQPAHPSALSVTGNGSPGRSRAADRATHTVDPRWPDTLKHRPRGWGPREMCPHPPKRPWRDHHTAGDHYQITRVWLLPPYPRASVWIGRVERVFVAGRLPGPSRSRTVSSQILPGHTGFFDSGSKFDSWSKNRRDRRVPCWDILPGYVGLQGTGGWQIGRWTYRQGGTLSPILGTSAPDHYPVRGQAVWQPSHRASSDFHRGTNEGSHAMVS